MGVGGFHLARGFPPAGVVIALGLPSARPMPGPGASLRQGSSPPHPHMPHLCFLKVIFFFFKTYLCLINTSVTETPITFSEGKAHVGDGNSLAGTQRSESLAAG